MKKSPLTAKDIADFFTDLTLLRQAEIPEKEALQFILDNQDNKAMRPFLKSLLNAPDLVTGLSQFPEIIPEYIIALLNKASVQKVNSEILQTISQHLMELLLLENAVSYRQKLKTLFTYPIAVLTIVFILFTLMSIFVVPVFANVFAGFGAELPAMTLLVIHISEWMQSYWWILVIVIFASIQLWQWAYRNLTKFRCVIDSVLLHIPIIGQLLCALESIAVISVLDLLLHYEFDISQALRLSASATKNVALINALNEAANQHEKRASWSSVLKQQQVFSAKTIYLLATFEKTQQLQTLANLTQSYKQQIQQYTHLSLQMMNTLLLLSCAFIVGNIIISMYLPIFMLGSVV